MDSGFKEIVFVFQSQLETHKKQLRSSYQFVTARRELTFTMANLFDSFRVESLMRQNWRKQFLWPLRREPRILREVAKVGRARRT